MYFERACLSTAVLFEIGFKILGCIIMFSCS